MTAALRRVVRGPSLLDLSREFLDGRAGSTEFHHRIGLHVRRATRRYPEVYFDVGTRDDTALNSLTDDTLFVARCVPRGRHPYHQRLPIEALIADQATEAELLTALVYGQFSIMRELLFRQYRRRMFRGREAGARCDAVIYQGLGSILRERAVSLAGRPPRWTLQGARVGLGMPAEQMILALRARAPWSNVYESTDLWPLIEFVLGESGRQWTRAALTRLVLQVVPPEGCFGMIAEGAASDRGAIRDVVRRVLSRLCGLDQEIVGALAYGLDPQELGLLDGSLAGAPAREQRLAEVGEHFVQAVLDDLALDKHPPDASLPLLIAEVVREFCFRLRGPGSSAAVAFGVGKNPHIQLVCAFAAAARVRPPWEDDLAHAELEEGTWVESEAPVEESEAW